MTDTSLHFIYETYKTKHCKNIYHTTVSEV